MSLNANTVKIDILAIGDKMPGWVDEGVQTYIKRLPPTFQVTIHPIPLVKRTKTNTVSAQKKESDIMLAKIKPNSFVIALDVLGKPINSHDMAKKIASLSHEYASIQLLIGGPEGLSQDCLNTAHAKWSLSKLTFAHPIVRVVLAESLYRSYTLINQHPYHK